MDDNLSTLRNKILQGNSFELVNELPDDSVNCVITSPPYWGLRDYGTSGQIGLEDTLIEYIDQLVSLGSNLRRVLRKDGSFWLNIGDIFAGSDISENELRIKRKSKALVPHRIAIALMNSGWIVRSDVVWSKTNAMPHSVSDRLNEEKEFFFHLVPEHEYWFDLDSIREQYSNSSIGRIQSGAPILNRASERYADSTPISGGASYERAINPKGKNPGDVWEAPVGNHPEAHFAVFPEKLIQRPIKATCPLKVCSECGTPYVRDEQNSEDWIPSCDCNASESDPGVVLDPFMGSGTTAKVAKRLKRHFIGFELNPDYVAMAQKRAGITVDEPRRLLDEEDATTLSDFNRSG